MTEKNFLAVFGDYIEEPYTSIFKDCEMLRLDADPGARTISTVMKKRERYQGGAHQGLPADDCQKGGA